ncbi:unnamed protein product [Camellia sinensis]
MTDEFEIRDPASSGISLEKGENQNTHSAGDLVTAGSLFNELSRTTLISWNAIIAGHVQNGLVEMGLSLYYKMRQSGLTPDQYTFASVFRACATLATLQQGKQAKYFVVCLSIISCLYVAASMKKGADLEMDEVYAQMTLQPVPSIDLSSHIVRVYLTLKYVGAPYSSLIPNQVGMSCLAICGDLMKKLSCRVLQLILQPSSSNLQVDFPPSVMYVFQLIQIICEEFNPTTVPTLFEILGEVINAGATTVNVPDTVGYTVPDEFGQLIADIKANTPGIENVIISTHCHNDLGLSTANTLAVCSRQVEVTINGIGERAGNASLEEVQESTIDIWGMGSLWTIAVVILVNMHLAMDIKRWLLLTHSLVWGSIIITYACVVVLDSIPIFPNYGLDNIPSGKVTCILALRLGYNSLGKVICRDAMHREGHPIVVN